MKLFNKRKKGFDEEKFQKWMKECKQNTEVVRMSDEHYKKICEKIEKGKMNSTDKIGY